MHITQLALETTQFAAQRKFYVETLGFPLVGETDTAFTVQAGTTRLTFQTAAHEAKYHFAFTIPQNLLAQAREWLAIRVPLIRRDNQDVFNIDIWNSHSVYFYDPAGNIGEFIAHHDLRDDRPAFLGVQDILRLSEIGLVVEDVPGLVNQLRTWLNLEPYKGYSHPEFTAVGDIYGLFIVVKRGRIWFPTAQEGAVVASVLVTLKGLPEQEYQVLDSPIKIAVAAAPEPNRPVVDD